ncbi:hypothetical protein AKJ59_00870 [candidate division MSBL1 archaeon SCGC-AAA385M02]|uniref:Uncharacterized protein n=1 Tax=candidate division MSBL1 archaeon SCGC-AAA385M02 TaxID=1698287 RepID=A0A133VPW6_9EURY|nr:hypothetical protein AKJ59_00870 [candidate division MSBL1 archaeon SCGC-AAA385M02]
MVFVRSNPMNKQERVERIKGIIHNTREWQALHLEVQAEILRGVKKGLATALSEEVVLKDEVKN